MILGNKSIMLATLLPWVGVFADDSATADNSEASWEQEGFGRSIGNPSTDRQQSPLMLKDYAESLLEDFLQFENSVSDKTVENLVNHGCWCAKLTTSPYLSYLKVRNPEPLDALDAICRDWMRMRNCNDQLSGGSCEAANSLENGSYTLKINSNNADLSSCDSAANSCSMDTCHIDLHFMKQIKNFLTSPAGQSWSSNEVVSDGVCIGVTPQDEDRMCTGTAPNLEAVVAPPVTEAPKTAEQVVSEKIAKTVEDAGGSMCPGNGNNPNCLQFKLYWDNMDGTRNDFDIAVIPPTGGFLWYASKNVGGGVCEIDANESTDYPVENIYFADANKGPYRVAMRNRAGSYGPIDAWIEVTRGNGYKKLYPFSFTRGRINMNCFTMYV